MTKAKAMELMLEMSTEIIDPQLARKIAKAFGYTLNDLDISPKKVKDFPRINYASETGNLTAVSVHILAQNLAKKVKSVTITSRMLGMGSRAQDITEKAIACLKK